MTRRPAAPMPEALRRQLRAQHHPAQAIPCPHCQARAHRPCAVRATGRQTPGPHPARATAWAQASACCPQCQAEPTAACHDDGRPRRTIHNHRYTEAEATA
jgi:hypothetical protein